MDRARHLRPEHSATIRTQLAVFPELGEIERKAFERVEECRHYLHRERVETFFGTERLQCHLCSARLGKHERPLSSYTFCVPLTDA